MTHNKLFHIQSYMKKHHRGKGFILNKQVYVCGSVLSMAYNRNGNKTVVGKTCRISFNMEAFISILHPVMSRARSQVVYQKATLYSEMMDAHNY